MKIYFAGAIRGGREKVHDYQKMVKQFEKCGGEVLTKHVADPNLSVKGENMSLKEIYEKGANVSGFLRGNEKIEFLAYESLDEVIDLINKIML